jgi:PhzF family phenazine biosynthesis protein
MKLPIFQVDTFTGRLFGGNPAAVVLMDEWLPDPVLQSIAAENNLAETAFVIPRNGTCPLRRFTRSICAVTRRWRAHTCCSGTGCRHWTR